MKRKVSIIGVGAGNPDHVTVQAVKAMNKVDVFFIPDKGAEKAELARVRHEILHRHVHSPSFRTVEYRVPTRSQEGEKYRESVSTWHEEIGRTFERLLFEELGETETGAFLVWGDPSLYDSTIRILSQLRATAGYELEYEVIAGISSVQALAAQHRVALNAIGRAVLLTNGRALAAGFPDNVDSVAVFLNADHALREADGDLEVFWGAYVGMPQEVLVSGKAKDVAADIERIRTAAREKNGWIMDCLLLKKP